MRPPIRTILLVAAAFFLVGCPARWKVVFINGTTEPLRVTVPGGLSGSPKSFRVLPDKLHAELLGYVDGITVFDDRGARLFERAGLRLQDVHAKYPHIYILLTTTDAYPIADDYAKTWRQHVDEITRPK